MRVHLVRHGSCDGTGAVLHGRAPGVSLNAQGCGEALAAAAALAQEAVAAIHTSPMERAAATAELIARYHTLTPVPDDAFIEVDYGAWTGREPGSLDDDPAWSVWNSTRSTAAPPDGEAATAVQQRALAGLNALATRYADRTVVVVTHADVIRAVVAHYLSFSLDASLHLEIAPASITTLVLWPDWHQILRIGVT